MIDVAVVGAGPAGTTVATLLKQRHPERRIALFDRARFPRHAVGSSLLPGSRAVLDQLGVLPAIDAAGFVRKGGITYRWRADRPVFADEFPHDTHAWQVRREEYDAILLQRAREVGVDVHEGVRVSRVQGGLVVDGERSEVDVIVDATGRTRWLSRQLGVDPQSYPLGDVAFYRFYDNISWDEALLGTPARSRIFFAACESGWVWFVPLSSTRASVGLVTRKAFVRERSPQELYERELGVLGDLLRDARVADVPCAPSKPLHAVEDWSYRLPHACGQREGQYCDSRQHWYAVGDAAAFVDPVLSSGVMLAHRTGLACANAIGAVWSGAPVADIHEAYSSFVRDQADGFARMATWWYAHRDHAETDAWFAEAEPSGTREGFLRFVAGHLADVRFADVGVGYGAEGIDQSFRGVLGEGASEIRSDLPDRSRRFRKTFVSHAHDTEWLTASTMTTWQRLPVVRFGEHTWRPVFGSHEGFRAAVDQVVERADGTRDVDALVAGPHRQLANLVVADLARLGLLVG